MSGHAYGQNNYCNAFVFIPYCRYRYKSDRGQHANNISGYFESAITITLCFIGNNCFYRRIRRLDLENKSNITGRHVSIDS